MASCVTGSDLHQSAAPPIRVPPPCGPRPRTPRRPETMARKGVSYVTAAQLVSMVRDPRVAIIDVRDEERICDAHIAGSDHYASDGFADRLPEIAEATRGKETLVFHCALSQWNNLELENFKDKINEVTGVMAAVYGGDHKFSWSLFWTLVRAPTVVMLLGWLWPHAW